MMTKDNPIFAVIIPVYNGQDCISDCLNSLINQSYDHWVAICVNDGSTDNTLEILSEYASQDPRIHVISKENGGVSSTRNTALEYLSNLEYDWISFFDADDVLSKDNLFNLKEITSRYPYVDFIRTHCKPYQNREDMLADALVPHAIDSVKIMSPAEYFNSGDVGGFIASCHIKCDLYESNYYKFPEDMKLMEDQVFSIRNALCANEIANV